MRREKKSFNVSPQSLIPSLVPKPVRAIRVTRGSFPDKLDRWRHIRNRRGRLGTRLPHSVFSLDPDLCLTARAYLNAQKHGLFHSLPSLLLNYEIFECRRSKRENATRLLWQFFKRTLSRVGKANPRFHRSTKVWRFKQKLISLKGTSSICVKCNTGAVFLKCSKATL